MNAPSTSVPAFRSIKLVACLLGPLIATGALDALGQTPATARARPRVGIALGGGSARGIAHVGVLRWLEEHRIPIDAVAGTSMGGLIGGAYATGMTPDEVETMIESIDWDTMFSGSRFVFQTVRRKRDSRAYPSHLELGLKAGLSVQTSLNGGQQVDLLFDRVTAPYYGLESFDKLPTPFRCVAFDLRTATRVVLDRGSMARALRATMSLPAVFPPVVMGEQTLVDGGVIDNIPADVARDMGADAVIAVNVGDLTDKQQIAPSLLTIPGTTMDAMMRVNTLKGLAAAQVVINVPVADYGSLDWRRFRDLIKEGYDAAEAARNQLLPLAVDAETWEAWREARAAARRRMLPSPAFIEVEGAGSSDASVMHRALRHHAGRTLDVAALEASLIELGGMGRYESLTWEIVERDGTHGLVIRALPKTYAPPFLFFGVSLENTTSNTFRFGLSGRYLAFDVVGSGSELRVDAAIGSDPSAGISLYRPLWSTNLFVEPLASVAETTLNVVDENRIVAAYEDKAATIGADAGVNLGRLNEVRTGVRWGHADTTVDIGDPDLPEASGKRGLFHLRWTHDSQDNAVVAARGVHAVTELRHFFTAPVPDVATNRSTDGVTQAVGGLSWLHPLDREARNRLFFSGGAGTSFGDHPLPTEQFSLGGPFRLSALDAGAKRGDNFVLASSGFLRQVARLPDFLGGPLLLGSWIESGSAFDDWDAADFDTNIGGGVIAETLIGAVFTGVSTGFDGSWRFYLGVGRIFR
jgi:NTE family protein